MGHHRVVAHRLHVDTAVLRSARLVTEALGASLQRDALDPADLADLAGLPGGPALVSGHDQLVDAVSATVRELAELDVALGTAAAALDGAEWAAVLAIDGGDR